jgi:hypothetical protein
VSTARWRAIPWSGLKATLVDGSYHPVDSSEMAFKIAAQLAYKAGIAQANPVLLEPIGELQVVVPDSYTGDVMGDLNKRRGRVMGTNPPTTASTEIVAEVPDGRDGHLCHRPALHDPVPGLLHVPLHPLRRLPPCWRRRRQLPRPRR